MLTEEHEALSSTSVESEMMVSNGGANGTYTKWISKRNSGLRPHIGSGTSMSIGHGRGV